MRYGCERWDPVAVRVRYVCVGDDVWMEYGWNVGEIRVRYDQDTSEVRDVCVCVFVCGVVVLYGCFCVCLVV